MPPTNDPPSQQPPPAANQPPQTQTQPDNVSTLTEKERNPLIHTAALAMAILGPIALILPSRGRGGAKSTLQNAVLGGAAFWGANQLAEEYTGKSITARSGERWGAVLGISNKSEDGEGEGEGEKKASSVGGIFNSMPTETAARNRALMAAERRRRAEAEGREYKEPGGGTLFERLWMGKEREGWQEKRLEEERKALESGKGYGELIADQVREVFGKKDAEEGKKDAGEGKKEGADGKGKGE